MGLSIHYRGTLTDKKQIYPLMDELEDIARSMQWTCRRFDEDWSRTPDARLSHEVPGQISIEGEAGLKGVMLDLHEQCESLWLCFNASGALTSVLQVALLADEGYPSAPGWLSVKTQFAGADIHIAIVKLLRYLKGKYLHDLEVEDESGYWQNGKREAVTQQINLIGQGLRAIEEELESADPKGEADIVARIEQALRRMQKWDKNKD